MEIPQEENTIISKSFTILNTEPTPEKNSFENTDDIIIRKKKDLANIDSDKQKENKENINTNNSETDNNKSQTEETKTSLIMGKSNVADNGLNSLNNETNKIETEKQKSKPLTIIESDSDEENNVNVNTNNEFEIMDTDNTATDKNETPKYKTTCIIDSDSEEDNNVDVNKKNDSEDENMDTNNSETDKNETQKQKTICVSETNDFETENIFNIDKSNDGDDEINTENMENNKRNDADDDINKENKETEISEAKRQKTKRLAVIDSDSEEENNVNINKNHDSKDEDTNISETRRNEAQKLSTRHVIDSDSEEENNVNMNTNNDSENKNMETEISERKRQKTKRLTLIDSDSEEENNVNRNKNNDSDDELCKNNENLVNNTLSAQKSKYLRVINSDSDEEDIANMDKKQASRLKSLCDSDSSDEEMNTNNICVTKILSDEETITPKVYKKKPKNKEETESKKMSAKEAAEQKKEIKSESQRMLRESNVSLPYHKPKSHTLKEFLARRSTLTSTLPLITNLKPSVAMKMTPEQLKLISNKIKEREKEVKEFYKSESEQDSDSDEDYVPDKTDNIETEVNTEAKENTTNEDKDEDTEELNTELIIEKDPNEGKAVENNLDEETQLPIAEAEELNSDPTLEIRELQKMDEVKENNTEVEELNIEPNETEKSSETETEILNTSETQQMSESKMDTEEFNTSENTVSKDRKSMDYEFNLDGLTEEIEETSKKICETTEEINKEGKEISKTIEERNKELDEEIENFEMVTEEPKAEKTISELLKEKLATIQPRLSGNPNEFINLDSGLSEPNAVEILKERFTKHTTVKHIHKQKVKLDVISVSGGEIHKETVTMSANEDNDIAITEEAPGVKFKKLRCELMEQMALKRSKFWKERQKGEVNDDAKDVHDGEKSECGDDFLDYDEEEDIEEEEEEELVDFENMKDEPKKKKKCGFVDGEAEVSGDDEDEEEQVEEDEEQEDNEAEEMENNEEIGSNKDPDEDTEQYSDVYERIVDIIPKRKPLKRIAQAFAEDSDDEETPCAQMQNKDVLDDTVSAEEDFIPPHQRTLSRPQITITQQKSEFDFLTPITFITGLQNLQSASKDSEAGKEDSSDFTNKMSEPSFGMDSENSSSGFTNEFSQNENTFTEKSVNTQTTLATMRVDDEPPTTQDLLNICSGGFTGISALESTNPVGISEEIRLNSAKEIKSLDEDQDMMISQLLDEEELENFKKKFDSPGGIITYTQRKEVLEEVEDGLATGGVIDSEDEDIEVKKKKKQQKKLLFSDDENSDGDENDVNDEVENEEETEEEEDAVEIDNLDYDSEENEIEIQKEKAPLKISEYFDKEAELSESEWGSADEDEKDLDELEFEQGDKEKFDEEELRGDLEKIHMRRILDDDSREVKLLQEMLLEDGELHGTGRQRQFKWKNIDAVGEDGEVKNDEEQDGGYLDEEESEEQWRKRRFEREMFLKEKLKSSQHDDDDETSLLGDSQILKMGQKVVKICSAKSQPEVSAEKEDVVPKPQFSIFSKRGSFLTRNDQVLQRLAEYNKVTTNANVGLGTAKNSRNFVFQSALQDEDAFGLNQDKKRKAADGTPKVLKKIRLSSNLSPVVKSLKKPDRAKSLFAKKW